MPKMLTNQTRRKLMNRFVSIFLLTISLVFVNSSNARAGTDIINNLLIKAGNVVDNISLKYQEISMEISKITEGKMFQLDDTTSDLIRNAIDDYYLVQAKINRIKEDVELAKSVYYDAVDYYNQANERINNAKEKAEEFLHKRGWFNRDDDEDDEDDEIGNVTTPRTIDDNGRIDDTDNDRLSREDDNSRRGSSDNNSRGDNNNSRGNNNATRGTGDNNSRSDSQSDDNMLKKPGNNEINYGAMQPSRRSFITDDDSSIDQNKNASLNNQLSEAVNAKK